MSDGSAMKISRTEHSSEAWRERGGEKENKWFHPALSSTQLFLVQAAGRAAGAFVGRITRIHRIADFWSSGH